MKIGLERIPRLPLASLLAIALGGVVLVSMWSTADVLSLNRTTFITAVLLVGGTIAAARFPIHLRQNTKLMVTTVPLFLMAVLLPPRMAALAAGIAMVCVGLLLRAQVGSTLPDIAMSAGRWIANAGLTALVVTRVAEYSQVWVLGLAAGALTMFAVEVLGSAFEIAPLVGESVRSVAVALVREGGLAEAVQYIIAIGGALIAYYQIWAVLLLAFPLGLVYLGLKRAKEMQHSTRRVLEDMADAIDQRDPYTGGHSRRVSEACTRILQSLFIVGMEAELIIAAARVHDIGKIGVPDEILLKPGKLTAAERKQIEAHVEIGAQLLQRYHDFSRGREMVRHHHERWDGKGYPDGLKEVQIPFGARVIAVADSFDAMTSDRPYRPAFTPEKALLILQEGRGTQWDPRIVDAFVALQSVTPAPIPEPSRLDPVRA